ncbi:hypothetical protein [Paenibacillus harenae]|uniref:Uncharacterized protein n=1 Tax=Paenibacillus harenae TaxID=306543 RepID=A0ABT9U486_PAEHA|nr:hypothetical protein [Paenibacillus harenae]MDQ0114378.1 hypothetical protein [Paenibacillus harenae]
MFKSGFTLSTDSHLSAAMFNKTPVVAWQDGEIIDYGGLIEKQDEHTVTINGMHYMKAACEFKVR